jgi:alanyl-tRNA synthetase
VEFNYRWLTEELEIDPDEITFIEDVWAGGGNLGPSIEYFVGGLELGNMVFMQFKTFPDGRREPLQVQVIDVGIGLERVPWLINGTPTSYFDVFPRALEFLISKIKIDMNASIWEKYGPYSCLLNVDEVEDIDATWKWIADKIGEDTDTVKQAIQPIKEAYVILDHTRSVMMAITDGSLPSNVGGASNVRNILRRVFALLVKNDWWDRLGMQGFLELFDKHKEDLATIYGPFAEYKSFKPIIELEYERWKFTDGAQQDKLKKLLKKRKNKLSLDDWIVCITSWGLPADIIAHVTKTEVPGTLWYEIAERQERSVKAEPQVLYSTAHLPETNSLYYADHTEYNFSAKILEVFPNVTRKNSPSIVILDQSSFYPTSGGQEHDAGWMWVDGKKYDVVDVMKVGPCVLHVLDPPLPTTKSLDEWKGKQAKGLVDEVRRSQLRNNHTATHIVYASCRKVLGPHIWQNGAKKSIHQAHLDITHFKALTMEQEIEIQTEANRIVHRCRQITKGFMPKDVAEKKYGFHLYQGGVVPGNELRVVNIADTDTEACCGTHCDNTAEVGTIKIIKTGRVSDGILRLYFVAGENALAKLNEETKTLTTLQLDWGVQKHEILPTAERFFDGFKKMSNKAAKQDLQILDLQMKLHVLEPETKLQLIRTDQANPTLFIGNCPKAALDLQKAKKGIVYVGATFMYGLLGDKSLFDPKALEPLFAEFQKDALARAEESKEAENDKKDKKAKKVKPVRLMSKNQVVVKSANKKIKPVKVKDVVEFSCYTLPGLHVTDKLVDFLVSKGFTEKVI